MEPKDILNKDFLEREYILLQKSVNQIARENNIKSKNSISQYIQKYNLSRPSKKNIENFIKKEDLELKYIQENKSLKTIANEYGLENKTSIKNLLIKYNIPIRIKRMRSAKFLSECKKRRKGYKEINGRYWNSLMSGAKKRNIVFNITIEFAWNLFERQNKRCALTNLDICFKTIANKQNEQTASLDRIDSSKGYTEDNVQWVHKDINKMKQNLEEKDFIKYCILVTKHKEY